MSRRGRASVRQLTLPLGRAVHGDETAAGTRREDAPVEGTGPPRARAGPGESPARAAPGPTQQGCAGDRRDERGSTGAAPQDPLARGDAPEWGTLVPKQLDSNLAERYASPMPRQPRLDAPGTLHHVMVRGIERRAIFRDDTDRADFVARLGRAGGAGGLHRLRLGPPPEPRPPPGPDRAAARSPRSMREPPHGLRGGLQPPAQAGGPPLPEPVQVHRGGGGALPPGTGPLPPPQPAPREGGARSPRARPLSLDGPQRPAGDRPPPLAGDRGDPRAVRPDPRPGPAGLPRLRRRRDPAGAPTRVRQGAGWSAAPAAGPRCRPSGGRGTRPWQIRGFSGAATS